MAIAKCPICQCEDFYWSKLVSHGGVYLRVSFFFHARVNCLVCLGCVFIINCVDQDTLRKVRAKARKKGVRFDETPSKVPICEL